MLNRDRTRVSDVVPTTDRASGEDEEKLLSSPELEAALSSLERSLGNRIEAIIARHVYADLSNRRSRTQLRLELLAAIVPLATEVAARQRQVTLAMLFDGT